jgi:hypothetical protein
MNSSAPMIEFKCHCGQPFKVENDQAGGLLQCPACGRLNDVPTLSDLRNIDAEGNYKVSDLELADEPDRLRKVVRAFTRSRVDDDGQEIDLRTTDEEVLQAGVDEIPLTDDVPPSAPKYDPLTGELIEPLGVKPHPAREPIGAIPMATAVLSYTSRATYDPSDARTWGLLRVGLELLRPLNVLVMLFVMLMQFLWIIAMIPVLGGIFFLVPLMVIPMMVLLGYFGKVVEETGPGDLDELPRPLGSVSVRDDVWSPFVGVMGAVILAFWPVAVVPFLAFPKPTMHALVLFLTAGGAVVYPALLLTLMTSGSVHNLRPDRVLGVIRQGGWMYWGIVLLFVLSQVANLLPISRVLAGLAASLAPGAVNIPVVLLMGAILSWIVSLHLILWACFGLGLLYRRKHEAFPWVFQKHEYRNRTRQPFRRARPRAAVAPPPTPARPPR